MGLGAALPTHAPCPELNQNSCSRVNGMLNMVRCGCANHRDFLETYSIGEFKQMIPS